MANIERELRERGEEVQNAINLDGGSSVAFNVKDEDGTIYTTSWPATGPDNIEGIRRPVSSVIYFARRVTAGDPSGVTEEPDVVSIDVREELESATGGAVSPEEEIRQLRRWARGIQRVAFDRLPLAERFVGLKRTWDPTKDNVVREEAVRVTFQLLERIRRALSGPTTVDAERLATIFHGLAVLLVEAGPYGYEAEANPAKRAELAKTFELMQELRNAIADALGVFLSRPEFGELRDRGYLRDEILPSIAMAARGTDPTRFNAFMPFRGIIMGNVFDALYEMKFRTEDPAVRAFIDRLYVRKYQRFGTSGLRARAGIDFSPREAAYAAEAWRSTPQHRRTKVAAVSRARRWS